MRLTACLAVALDVIGPCAFPLSDKKLKRAALDYGPHARVSLHDSWSAFLAAPERTEGRLILFTTGGTLAHYDFAYQPGDTLLFGRESAGVTDEVRARADHRLVIPIAAETRSLNLVAAAAIGLAEALRQVRGFPPAPACGL